MAQSWQDSLQAFLDSNPGLPEGETPLADDNKPAPKPRLDIILDRKGRAGKTATIIAGFDSTDDTELKRIASELKSRLATGGAARGGEILVQGDRRNDVKRILDEMGYKTRLI